MLLRSKNLPNLACTYAYNRQKYYRNDNRCSGYIYINIYIPIMYMAALGYMRTYISTVVHRTTTRPTWRSYRLISILNFFLLDRSKKTNWSTINVTGSRVRVFKFPDGKKNRTHPIKIRFFSSVIYRIKYITQLYACFKL